MPVVVEPPLPLSIHFPTGTTGSISSAAGSIMDTTTNNNTNTTDEMVLNEEYDEGGDDDDDDDDDDEGDDKAGGPKNNNGKGRNKSRRELPTGAVATLKAWLLSPEHFTHPYPTPQDQATLMQTTGIDKKQLKNWFTNARRRIWKPLLKKQIEQQQQSGGATTNNGTPAMMAVPSSSGYGTTTATASVNGGGGGILLNTNNMLHTINPSMDNPHSVQAVRVHYQQAMQEQQQQQQLAATASMDNTNYNTTTINPMYGTTDSTTTTTNFYGQPQQLMLSQQQQQQHSGSSIGTLLSSSAAQQQQPLSKTDSHAVLMELFARDQDLVRQATESARLKAESKHHQQQLLLQQQQQTQQLLFDGQQQLGGGGAIPAAPMSQHPMNPPTLSGGGGSGTTLGVVPSLNSWPQFSSITSLNNLGTMPGVKSIASLSGIDLVSKGGSGGGGGGSFNNNKFGNLAQVKSMESMGKNDSYAFLEVFFGDRSSTNLSGMMMGGGVGSSNNIIRGSSSSMLMGGGKHNNNGGVGGEEDNEIGLSLEDESPSHAIKKDYHLHNNNNAPPPMGQHMAFGTSVMSANGVVGSQSGHVDMQAHIMGSDALKRAYDDALAARGLMSVSRSSEKLTDLVLPAKIQRTLSQEFINMQQEQEVRQQVQLRQQQQHQHQHKKFKQEEQDHSMSSHQYGEQETHEPSGDSDARVQVASTAVCASCSQTNVDTQLRPCGHMFHESCLKPSLNDPNIPPKCPIDDIPIHSAVLAIPDNNADAVPQPVQQVTSSVYDATQSNAFKNE